MNQPVTAHSSTPRTNKMVSGYNCESERCSRLADCRSGFKGWRKAEELGWGQKGRENIPLPRYSQWSCFISQCCSLISTRRWFKGWEEGAAIDSSLICSRYVLTTAQVSLWVIIASWEIKQDISVLWCIMTLMSLSSKHGFTSTTSYRETSLQCRMYSQSPQPTVKLQFSHDVSFKNGSFENRQ